jgi:hypothetical protein
MSWPISGRFRTPALTAFIALAVLAGIAAAQTEAPADRDYPRLFGSAYRNARDFIAGNEASSRAFGAFGIPAGAAWAIVFPELIRWSALADLIQTANLQALYVQFGAGYSDFSVGRFQMKPSFAETIEGDFNRLLPPVEQKAIRGGPFETGDTVENRRARVRRLTDLDDQVRYLIIFFRVMDRLYASETWASDEDKVRFYAAAYNSGYRAGAARIRRETGRSRFQLGLVPAKPFYNYSDIAADFLRRYAVTFPSSAPRSSYAGGRPSWL